MAAESPIDAAPEGWNYFNYFTEIEEHFQRARGSGLFLLSPLDWALIETWKDAGIPLEAVLRGIDSSFATWHSKKKKLQQVNSLAYCVQAVAAEAQVMAGGAPAAGPPAKAPFLIDDLREYLVANTARLRDKGAAFEDIAAALEKLASEAEQHYNSLEDLERRLTVLEDKMSAIAKTSQDEETLLAARRELDFTLRPYRGKMTADQLSMLERQFLERRLLEAADLPRLSLFYLRPEDRVE